MKFLKSIVSFILIFVLIVLPVSAESFNKEIDSSTKTIENSTLKFSVDQDGAFSLTDIESGMSLYSRNSYTEVDKYSLNADILKMSSEVVIDCYNIADEINSDQSSLAYSREAEITVQNNDGNIQVDYDFTQYGIEFYLIYSVRDKFLEVDLDVKSIKENGDFKLNSITLLPAIMSGIGDDDGYIFVPDGCGGIIDFNNNSNTSYSAKVYGDDISLDAELKKNVVSSIYMPVFGMVKNDVGMFAIIESGDANAEISAATKNTDSYYNYVNTTFIIRNTFSKNMFGKKKSDKSVAYSKNDLTKGLDKFTVRYYLLPESSTYTDMAKIYREYLKNEKGLSKNIKEPVINIDLLGAIDVKANFLGFTYYKTIALTTYKDAIEFMQKIKNSEINDVSLRYVGWNNNGITNNRVLKKLSTIGVLGGNKDFFELNQFAQKFGFKINYDVDMLRFYKGNKKYVVNSPFNEKITFSRYLRSVYSKDISKRSWYMLSGKYLENNFTKIFKSAEKLNIENISLSSLSKTLYSDLKRNEQYTREEMKNQIVSMLSKSKLEISGETANVYATPYLTKVYSSPFYSSGYNIIDEEIPFYQIVLHGLVNLTGESQFVSNNRNVNYLKAVETGTELLYTGMAKSTSVIVDTDYDYLYGTNFDLWIDDALNKYNEYQPLLRKIYDSEITEHLKIQHNVYMTIYENGVKVIVNYNSSEVNIGGVEIKGYGFCEVTGSEN